MRLIRERRQRASEGRIRAYMRTAGLIYHVYSKGTLYKVLYNYGGNRWECSCPTRHQTCMHIQRVMDREERRIRQDSEEYKQRIEQKRAKVNARAREHV